MLYSANSCAPHPHPPPSLFVNTLPLSFDTCILVRFLYFRLFNHYFSGSYIQSSQKYTLSFLISTGIHSPAWQLHRLSTSLVLCRPSDYRPSTKSSQGQQLRKTWGGPSYPGHRNARSQPLWTLWQKEKKRINQNQMLLYYGRKTVLEFPQHFFHFSRFQSSQTKTPFQ